MFNLIKNHFTCAEIDRFEGVEFETFISMELDAIKEVIPEVIPRLNFMTQYKNYLNNLNLQPINQNDISDVVTIECSDSHAQSSTGILHTKECVLTIESFNDVNTFDESENGKPAIRSITSPQDIVNIPSIELKILLKQYTQKHFDNADRVLIGKEIIRYILLPHPERIITREEFMQISEHIVTLFPTETAGCYYTEAHGQNQVQGKLYTAYSKLKGRLRDVGLIQKRPKAKSAKETQEELLPSEQSNTAFEIVCMEENNFERVQYNWILSHKQRTIEVLPKSKTFDYVSMFPALSKPKGYELFCIDASLHFPNITSVLPEVSKKLIIFASRLRNRSLDVNVLIKEFDDIKNNHPDNSVLIVHQQLIALKLLPHLIKGYYKRKMNAQSVVSFYTSYKSFAEAEEKDHHTTSALPYLNLIGGSPIPVAQVVVSGRKYVIEDPTMGFDVLFKAFVALALNYPDESKHLWLFIQKSVYNVHKASDIKIASVSTFIKDICNVSDD